MDNNNNKDIIIILIFLASSSLAIYLLAKFITIYITKEGASFTKKAGFFCRKININFNTSKTSLQFKDLFFLTLEDYLNYYYPFSPALRKSVRRYLIEHFDSHDADNKLLTNLIRDVLIGHFMRKKIYATGETWVLSTKRDLSFLDKKIDKAIDYSTSKYPTNQIISLSTAPSQ